MGAHRLGRARSARLWRRLVARRCALDRPDHGRADWDRAARGWLCAGPRPRRVARRSALDRHRRGAAGTRLLHAADTRPRALHVPGVRLPAAPRHRQQTLGRGHDHPVDCRVHQHARHPDDAALRVGERRDTAAGRVLPRTDRDRERHRPVRHWICLHCVVTAEPSVSRRARRIRAGRATCVGGRLCAPSGGQRIARGR